MKIGDIKPPPPRILLYGKAGSGKSALSYTLGEGTQVFDFERGWESGRTLVDQFTPQRKLCDIAGPVDEITKMPTGYVDRATNAPSAFLKFKSDIIKVADAISAKTYPFRAVIVDSLTTMFEASMRNILHNQGKKWKDIDPSSVAGGFIQIQHWGFAFTDITNILNILRSLPIVVILLAHTKNDVEVTTVSEDGKLKIINREIIGLGISGRDMPDKVPSYFEEFWYLKFAGTKRVIQTLADAQVEARSRLNVKDNTEISQGLPAMLKSTGFDWEEFKKSKL